MRLSKKLQRSAVSQSDIQLARSTWLLAVRGDFQDTL